MNFIDMNHPDGDAFDGLTDFLENLEDNEELPANVDLATVALETATRIFMALSPARPHRDCRVDFVHLERAQGLSLIFSGGPDYPARIINIVENGALDPVEEVFGLVVGVGPNETDESRRVIATEAARYVIRAFDKSASALASECVWKARP